MNQTLKKYAISSLVTFVSMFFLVLALELKNTDPVNITVPLVLSLGGVAARAAFKALVEWAAARLNGSDPIQG